MGLGLGPVIVGVATEFCVSVFLSVYLSVFLFVNLSLCLLACEIYCSSRQRSNGILSLQQPHREGTCSPERIDELSLHSSPPPSLSPLPLPAVDDSRTAQEESAADASPRTLVFAYPPAATDITAA